MMDLQKLPIPGFVLQAADKSRVSLVDVERTGRKALRLTTQPGDININGSGAMERCDLMQAVPGGTAPLVYRNVEQWWAHSVMFPADCQFPQGQAYMVIDFHNYPDSPGQPNLVLGFSNWNRDRTKLGELMLQRWIGDPKNPTERTVTLGPPVRNVWYDFVYHVRWSAGDDGFFTAWLNGQLVMAQPGPTLYPVANAGVYLKLANYHYPDGSGKASSVIHDRIALGYSSDELAAALTT